MNDIDKKRALMEKNRAAMADFANDAGVDTRSKIMARGTVPYERHPVHVTLRLPEKTNEFFADRVVGNKSLAITAIFDHAIEELEKKMLDGDFNIKEWLKKTD